MATPKPFRVESPQGARVDEYYWLRDDTRKSREVLDYLKAENTWRDTALAHTRPLQEQLYRELTGRLDPDESSVPAYDRGYWYYTRFAPGREYPVYARRKGSLDAPEEVLLDAEQRARGQDFFDIGATAVSDDGGLLAWTEDTLGRNQFVLRVKDLRTGRILPDAIPNVDSDFAWAADNRTLVYAAKNPVTLLAERVYGHVLGTPVAADALLYQERDPAFYMSVLRSSSGRFLFIALTSTESSEWLYAEAAAETVTPAPVFRPVLPRERGLEYQVDHRGEEFVLRTNWQAPNFRIVAAPMTSSADKSTWRDVVPHRADALVESFEVATGHLAVNERSGGLRKVRVLPWPAGGAPAPGRVIEAAEPAYEMRLIPTPGIESPLTRYGYSSLVTPPSVYDHDPQSGQSTALKTERVGGGFDSGNYRTAFLSVRARDGVEVPVSLAYRRGTPLDGTAPLYLYGYGSYGISTEPEFTSNWISLMDRGFVVANAHVRGGEELGRQWYDDGRLLHKMNTFTDYIDVTRGLVARGYGARDKVFASGASAGGLLMGAVANMAPGDYRAIVAKVPFVDVVTTMLDESIPLTTGEFDEWGNPKEKASHDYMLAYSPYDNVTPQDYPAMLVMTGLWDPAVQYWEPAKWVARLRARKTDRNPLILSVDMSAGHQGPAGRYQQYRDTALEYAFILDQLK